MSRLYSVVLWLGSSGKHQPRVVHQHLFGYRCVPKQCAAHLPRLDTKASHNATLGSQVLGHTKTVLILAIGWLQHQANPNISLRRQYIGSAVALSGLIAYNAVTALPSSGAPSPSQVDDTEPPCTVGGQEEEEQEGGRKRSAVS